MIHEFAVEPSLLNNWEQFRYVTEKFGFHQGRLISRYPSKWKKMVYESLDDNVSDIKKTKIVEMLTTIDEKMISRKSVWQDQPWLDNAEQEHFRRPFHAILGLANPRNHSHVLCYQDLHESLPLWNTPHQQNMPRTAAYLANALAPVFRVAKQIVFIDPHFCSSKRPAVDALTAYLQHCKLLDPYPEIVFLTRNNKNVNFKSECQQRLGPFIPIGKKLH